MFSLSYFGDELPTWALFLELFIAGTVVVLTGARFTRLADVMAEKLNIGGGWIGMILLATVTSLPEVVTGGSATWLGNPGMALAAVLGSCSFNITIIVLLNAILGGGSLLKKVSPSHTLSSSFGILLIGMALLGIALGEKFRHRYDVARVCEALWAIAIFITYLGCMRLIYRFEHRDQLAESVKPREPFGAGRWTQLVVIAGVLVLAAWWLARIGDTLSVHHIEALGRPLGATFVGAFFLALATSLPEITTGIAAVRLGNVDMALGNLFGSNMFNIFVIPMLKVVSLAGGNSLLMGEYGFEANPLMLTGLLAILLTAIAVGGLTYKSERRMLRRFGFDSILIAGTYVGVMILLIMEAGGS